MAHTKPGVLHLFCSNFYSYCHHMLAQASFMPSIEPTSVTNHLDILIGTHSLLGGRVWASLSATSTRLGRRGCNLSSIPQELGMSESCSCGLRQQRNAPEPDDSSRPAENSIYRICILIRQIADQWFISGANGYSSWKLPGLFKREEMKWRLHWCWL